MMTFDYWSVVEHAPIWRIWDDDGYWAICGGGLQRKSVAQPKGFATIHKKLEASTHKSAKTHAGNDYVTLDLDLLTQKWVYEMSSFQ